MKIPQYSLRSLFVFTAVVGLSAALCHWQGLEPEWIVAYGLLIGGFILIAVGLFTRGRRMRVATGSVMILIGLICASLFRVTGYSGGAFIQEIQFEVYDAISKQPIQGARILPTERKWIASFGNGGYWVTNMYGKATLTLDVSWERRSAVVFRWKAYSTNEPAWRVKAAGYRTVAISTEDFFKPGADSESQSVAIPPVKLYLEPLDGETQSEVTK